MEIETLLKKVNPENKREERIKNLIQDLRGGRKVTDFRFDQIYPLNIRRLSEIHWTPIEVAIRASELLVTSEKSQILDVGSGCGKFCVVGALSSPGQFTGIEQRPHLVDIARITAENLNVHQTSFLVGNMADLDWSCYDAFYLYNPFYENEVRQICIDDTVSRNQDKFRRYIDVVRSKLRLAAPGTRVATYHGFGGEMPFGYQLVKQEPFGNNYLELWVKFDISESS